MRKMFFSLFVTLAVLTACNDNQSGESSETGTAQYAIDTSKQALAFTPINRDTALKWIDHYKAILHTINIDSSIRMISVGKSDFGIFNASQTDRIKLCMAARMDNNQIVVLIQQKKKIGTNAEYKYFQMPTSGFVANDESGYCPPPPDCNAEETDNK
jgi:hypothetical protein